MFPDSLAKRLRIFFFFPQYSASCLKAPLLWSSNATLSLNTLPSPWHFAFTLQHIHLSAVQFQPCTSTAKSPHLWNFLQDSALIFSQTGNSLQLHCKFTRLRADTAQRPKTALPGNISNSPPSLLPLQNKWVKMNEWSSATDRKLMHWGLPSLFLLCYPDTSKMPGKKLMGILLLLVGWPVQWYYHHYCWCSTLVTIVIILCLHGAISLFFRSNHATFFCIFRQRTLTGEWHQAPFLPQHIRG